eukprot:8240455-Pyramimonas_sp.AAC.1
MVACPRWPSFQILSQDFPCNSGTRFALTDRIISTFRSFGFAAQSVNDAIAWDCCGGNNPVVSMPLPSIGRRRISDFMCSAYHVHPMAWMNASSNGRCKCSITRRTRGCNPSTHRGLRSLGGTRH